MSLVDRKHENSWMGRSLSNYKNMHEGTAKQKDVYKEFMATKTLTQARKVLFGYKSKNTR